MNPRSPQPVLPGLVKLFWNDHIIGWSARATTVGMLVAVGVWWVSQDLGAAPPLGATPEAEWSGVVVFGALGFAAFAATVLFLRFQSIRKILREGTVIKGKIEGLTAFARETDRDTHTTGKRHYSYTHYADVAYTFEGKNYQVRLRLPNSGFTFDLANGQSTDLSVLASSPNKPFLRAVYLGRI